GGGDRRGEPVRRARLDARDVHRRVHSRTAAKRAEHRRGQPVLAVHPHRPRPRRRRLPRPDQTTAPRARLTTSSMVRTGRIQEDQMAYRYSARVAGIAVVAAVVPLALAACSSSSSSTPAAASSATGGASSSSPAAAAGKSYNLELVVGTKSDDFYVTMEC